MDSPKVCQVVVLLLVLALIWRTDSHVFSHDDARSINGPAPESFVDSLFEEYGTNKSMSLQQFSSLLKELKLGSITRETTSKAGSPKENGVKNGHSKCYPAKALFESFSVDSSGLNPQKFQTICPAIVEQIESKACLVEEDKEDEEDAKQSKTQAWGYGFLSVTIISCASLLGAFVVPFMNQSFYKILLLFMVSLAVGVLSGSGVFHLIPHTFGFGTDGDTSYLWKCLVIICGIYLFFFLEYVMKMIVRFKQKSTCESDDGLENTKSKGEIPGAEIADVQLQLYNVNPEHHHSNKCISHQLPDIRVCGNGVKQNSMSDDSKKAVVENGAISSEKKKIAPVAWMIIIGDSLHNFIDGLAIGASFSSSTYVGISTALAIFCEELPHELGDFAVLLNAGMSYKMAMGFNFLSACSCYLGLVIGLLLGYTTSAVKWIYALAGGMFIYIALVDMLEEACEMSVKIGQTSIRKNLKAFALQNFGMLFGLTIMFILALYSGNISVE
ncbi:hypothetical protein ACROYT_G016986 [Oculina patagonica]